jgi:3-deoxy-manno-octulosonate cytidylyltransferase (CMP-KDO synthetase)
MSATAIAIIPARYASTRFPGKLLANDTGKPLIQHVYEQTIRAKHINRVIVATDDQRIFSAVKSFGGECVMTRPDHPNGSCRSAEAAAELSCDFIVNVQGDEPEIEPVLLDRAIEALSHHKDCVISTIGSPFRGDENAADPNIVKVVTDRAQRALYFSRSQIPYPRVKESAVTPLKHIGVYVYRREFLLEYVALPPTPLEIAESLEQLRVLEHGYRMAVVIAEAHHHGIDTPAQYAAFVRRWRANH